MATAARTLVALAALPVPSIADSIDLGIGKLTRNGWVAEGIEVSYRAADTDNGLRVRVSRLQPPTGEAIKDIRLDCPGFDIRAETLQCRDDAAAVTLPRIGDQTPSVKLTYDRENATVRMRVGGLALAGGQLALQGEWHQGDWRGVIEAETIDLAAAEALAGGWLPEGWSLQGQLDGDVTFSGVGTQPRRLVAKLNTDGAGFSDATGLRAAEGLTGRLEWRTRRQDTDWVGQAELELSGGQLYIDPVFTDFTKHPLRLTGDAVARPADGILELLGFELAQSGVIAVSGDASLTREPPYLARARLRDVIAQLPAAYTSYGRPFLRGSLGGQLETEGALGASASIRNGSLQQLRLTPSNVTLRDDQGRLALTRLKGDIAWAAGGEPEPPTSRVRWQDGTVYGVGIGSSELDLQLAGDDLRLVSPTTIPVLDGTLAITELAVRDITSDDREGRLDARLEPISMARLTTALGWPQFTGTLAGRLPSLSYDDGAATLGGTLRANVFGGEITARDLSLRDPLGSLPELTADIAIDGLDLETLTGTFEFGRITGSLDGDIQELRLLGWQPANFRAWFRNPDNDPRPHRISQRAVENLASFGGSGGAAALSRGFLRFFEDFRYDKLGLGCVLREDVCVMRGLADKGDGYYIVRGSGVPRVDVIGFINTVSWPTLVEQIRSATASGGPVVK